MGPNETRFQGSKEKDAAYGGTRPQRTWISLQKRCSPRPPCPEESYCSPLPQFLLSQAPTTTPPSLTSYVSRSHTHSTHAVRQVCLPWPQGCTSLGPIALQIIACSGSLGGNSSRVFFPRKIICSKRKIEQDRDQDSRSAHCH